MTAPNDNEKAKERHANLKTMAKNYAYLVTMFNVGIASSIEQNVTNQYLYSRVAAVYTDDLTSVVNVTKAGPCSSSSINTSSSEYKIHAEISAETSRWSMYLLMTGGIPPLLTILFLGALSDQIGRRFLCLLPLCISVLHGSIVCTVIYLKLHLAFLLLGQFLAGITGGSSTLAIAVFSYSSDQHGSTQAPEGGEADGGHGPDSRRTSVTTVDTMTPSANGSADKMPSTEVPDPKGDTSGKVDPGMGTDMGSEKENKPETVKNSKDSTPAAMYDKNRGLRILIIECVSILGRSIAQLLNGYFIKSTGFFYPMLTATLIHAATFVFTYFAIQRSTNLPRKTSACQTILQPLKTMFRAIRQPRKLTAFVLCNLALNLIVFADSGNSRTLPIYQMSPPFCWTSVEIGWWESEYTFVLLLSIPLLYCLRRLNLSEPVMAGIGICSNALGTTMYAVINGGADWVFYVGAVLIAPGMLPYALTRSITSRLAGPSAHGAMFALSKWLEQATFLIGGVTGSGLYQATVSRLHSAVFFFFTALYASSALVYFIEGGIEGRFPPLQFDDGVVDTKKTTTTHANTDHKEPVCE